MHAKFKTSILVALPFLFYSNIACSQKLFFNSSVSTSKAKQDFPNKAKLIESLEESSKTKTVKIFEFDFNALREPSITLKIFETPVTVIRDEMIRRNNDELSWHGHIQGERYKEGSLVLVASNGLVSGNLEYKSKNYAITPISKGLLAFYELEFDKLPKIEDAPGMIDLGNQPSSSKQTTSFLLNTNTPSKLRVLVAFTPSARSSIASRYGYSINQFALQAIALSNQGFLNSQVTYRLELAASIETDYNETGNYSLDLSRFRNTNDGYMDEIHAYRDLYSASVCVLITTNHGSCGLASAIQVTASAAFVEVSDNCALNNYTFGHEIAHLQGCRHNLEVDPTLTPFSYGHGYLYQPGLWRTIMAYQNDPPSTRINYYSNPDVSYLGTPLGNETRSNNALVLNNTIGTVASFRQVPDELILTDAGSLSDVASGNAVATNSITMEPGFDVAEGAVLDASIGSDFDNDLKDQANFNCTDELQGSFLYEASKTPAYHLLHASVDPMPSASRYNWYMKRFKLADSLLGSGTDITFKIPNNQNVQFKCEAITPNCKAVYLASDNGYNSITSSTNSFTVYPNPASNLETVK